MAQTFPLAVEFFAGLPVAECTMDLPSVMQVSRTRGGSITTAKLSERLWTAQVTLAQMRHRVAGGVEAQLSALAEPARSLLIHALPYLGPAYDPGAVLLSGASPALHTISGDLREIRISGLPIGFEMTAGDFLSFAYGSSPVRYAFHRVVVGATADAAGLTPLIEVTPALSPGATTSAAVVLDRPFFRAILMPGKPGRSRRVFTDGVTLDLIQTLGA